MESIALIVIIVLAYVVLKEPIKKLVSTLSMVVGYAEGRAKVLEPLAEKQNKLDLHAIDAELKKFQEGIEL